MNFTNRWQHRMTLTFRVWPREPRAHKLSVMGKEWSVDGLTYNRNEHLEACHRIGQKGYAAWELSDEDAMTLAMSGSAGAVVQKMRVKCPGAMDERAKKECWLEVEVLVYPDACDRAFGPARRVVRTVKCPWDDLAVQLQAKWRRGEEVLRRYMTRSRGKERQARWLQTFEPRTFTGFELHESGAVVNVPKIAESILSGKVVVFKLSSIDTETFAKLREKLNYYTIPGRKPEEEGGLYRGYQLGDGVVRWMNRGADGGPAMKPEQILAKMHRIAREAGQSRRRTVFVEQVVERLAKQHGVSRQRVMAILLEEGIVDYLVRSYDAAAAAGRLYVHGCAAIDLRGLISEAVRVLSFYIEGVSGKEVA